MIKNFNGSDILGGKECWIKWKRWKGLLLCQCSWLSFFLYKTIDLKTYKCWWEGMGSEEIIQVVRKGNKCYYKTEIGFI